MYMCVCVYVCVVCDNILPIHTHTQSIIVSLIITMNCGD